MRHTERIKSKNKKEQVKEEVGGGRSRRKGRGGGADRKTYIKFPHSDLCSKTDIHSQALQKRKNHYSSCVFNSWQQST